MRITTHSLGPEEWCYLSGCKQLCFRHREMRKIRPEERTFLMKARLYAQNESDGELDKGVQQGKGSVGSSLKEMKKKVNHG